MADKPVCFACGEELAAPNPAATAFYGHPDYGSRFDGTTAGNEPLEIHVCDDCLEAHAERINLRKETSKRRYEWRPWLCPDCLRPLQAGTCFECKEAAS
jgi:hypothetical protein